MMIGIYSLVQALIIGDDRWWLLVMIARRIGVSTLDFDLQSNFFNTQPNHPRDGDNMIFDDHFSAENPDTSES